MDTIQWLEPIPALYVKRAQAESDIKDHLPRLKQFCEQLMPIHVIELGVREGYSTVAFLMALRTRPHAHLYSVDIEPIFGELEEWLNRIDQWTFLVMPDMPYPEKLPVKADIIFIDTDHQLETTRAEIATYVPHLSEDGIMLFHDTARWRGFGVHQAIDEWTGAHTEWKSYFWEDCNGLGVLYRRIDADRIESIISKINEGSHA